MSKKEWLGKIPAVDKGLGKAGAFQADDRITSTEAGRHVIPEHDQAIDKAMKQLYGGLVGARCDPVEEWPGDADKPYGIPKTVQPLGVDYRRLDGDGYRDDAPPIVSDKAGTKGRWVAASTLSGAGDRIANDDDFAEQNEHDDDDSIHTHH